MIITCHDLNRQNKLYNYLKKKKQNQKSIRSLCSSTVDHIVTIKHFKLTPGTIKSIFERQQVAEIFET